MCKVCKVAHDDATPALHPGMSLQLALFASGNTDMEVGDMAAPTK